MKLDMCRTDTKILSVPHLGTLLNSKTGKLVEFPGTPFVGKKHNNICKSKNPLHLSSCADCFAAKILRNQLAAEAKALVTKLRQNQSVPWRCHSVR